MAFRGQKPVGLVEQVLRLQTAVGLNRCFPGTGSRPAGFLNIPACFFEK
ncbi:MAG: hypothetical protein ACPL4E_00420 [Thermoproteota archaeon]